MKTKYLLRGIGIGILISTLIMFAAARTNDKNNAGKDTAKVTTEATTEETTEATTEATTVETTEETTEATTEATTEEVTEEVTEEETDEVTEEETEEVTEEATEEATTEEATTEELKAGTVVTVVVSSGMSSEDVSSLLEDAGLVKSADDYNTFLMSKGYDAKLLVGSFEIKAGSSDKEIAEILTTPTE